jgi:DMSO/TMAO reductase YedYZ molybdopterin-dependent catalytic subunit
MSHIRLIQRVSLASAMILYVAVIAPLYAAEPEPPARIIVTSPSHAAVRLTIEDFARLPTVKIDLAFLTEHGERRASFEGPLLWTVLQKAGAVDPARHREQVSRTVVVIGTDGYRAVLALGEIAPEFEGKQVILAERMDGQPLGAGHLRLVVPLDKRGGRSVRDVAHIEVTALPP